MKSLQKNRFTLYLLAAAALFSVSTFTHAATAEEIDRDVDNSIQKLYSSSPTAKELSTIAKGMLVFPKVIKGGLIIGGQYGTGALREGGNTIGYYNTVAASYGLQAGVQSFGYAMFFMTDSALQYLKNSSGWEIGVGPSVVIVDKGRARSLTTTTAKDDIYVFFYGQEGLMAGIGLQGSKISQIQPDS
ncbi:MAG: lipid-binding SYLF domain-containing protein [Onishia taeanensis]|uniref:lipid-binding SYLF domain-containing protein n=1 Tax=Onishia taeanensis TaxID=284577 RepID=UPI003C7B556F